MIFLTYEILPFYRFNVWWRTTIKIFAKIVTLTLMLLFIFSIEHIAIEYLECFICLELFWITSSTIFFYI